MKNTLNLSLVFANAALVLGIASPALATDRFEDEIVCTSGPQTAGITVAIQTNATAWVQRASVRATGSDVELGSYTIPLNQPVVSTPDFLSKIRIARYEVEGFELDMQVQKKNDSSLQVLGPAHVIANLPGLLQPIDTDLNCEKVR